MGELYRLDFPSGKSYIGITSKTAQERFSRHAAAAGRLKFPVSNAIKKYGAGSVRVKTLAIADDWSYLCRLEVEAIKAYKTQAPMGYNVTAGGDGFFGASHTESTRNKIGEFSRRLWNDPAHKERHSYRVRQAMSEPSVKNQMSESQKRKWLDPEYRRRLVESHTGHKQKPETIKKRADAIKKSWRTGGRRHPTQKSDEEIFEIYSMKGKATQKEVAEKFNTSQPYVGGVWRHEKAKMALIRLGILESPNV